MRKKGGSLKAFKNRGAQSPGGKEDSKKSTGWKFPASCFELIDYVSPPWRPHVLAGQHLLSVRLLPGGFAGNAKGQSGSLGLA